MPWRDEVWQRLEQAQPPEFEPLLSAAEIGRWRNRTLNWFGGLKEEPGIEPRYITEATVHRFINRTVERLNIFFTTASN
jgi:hypothetical protein